MIREQYNDRDEWLRARRQMIGGSDAPVIYGHGYADQSRYSLWQEKAFGIVHEHDESDLKRFERGNITEETAIKIFTSETGIKVERYPFAIFRLEAYIGVSLDGLTIDGEPVEAKAVGLHQIREWDDGAPLEFQIQSQHQQLVVGAKRGWIVGFITPFDVRIHECPRNDKFLAAHRENLAEFWRYVELREPPPIDGTEATRKALHRLFPQDQGTEIALPAEALTWDAERAAAKEAIKEAEGRLLVAENNLKACIGEATFGLLPDGGRYSWKTQHVKAEKEPRKAFDKRVLLRCK